MLKRLSAQLARLNRVHHASADELVQRNINSFFYVCLVSAPVSLLHVFVFYNYVPRVPAEAEWRTGIIAFHSFSFFYTALMGFITYRLKNSIEATRSMYVVQSLSIVVILASGIIVTSIDQLVTSNITPFQVACILTPIVFIMHPLRTLLVLAAALTIFSLAHGYAQTDPAILLSNRVNGVTAISISLWLAIMLWLNATSRHEQGQRIAEQQQALRESNRKLEKLATYDALTGLYNRRAFLEAACNEQIQMHRQGHHSCLLMLDLDHFKLINDQHGHPVGDRVLQELARLIEGSLRASDVTSRWGGEEFLALLRYSDIDSAWEVAESLRLRIEQHVFCGEMNLRLTTSIGLAEMHGMPAGIGNMESESAFNQTYQSADQAMYQAKQSGRNRTVKA